MNASPIVKRIASHLPGYLFIALLLAAIEIAAQTGLVKAALIPPPSQVGKVLWAILVSGEFAMPMFQTLATLFIGWGIASISGIVLGVAMGYFPAVYVLFEPLVEILRTIPKPVLLPVLMLFLGLGDPMKICIVALASFFPVLINTIQAVRGIDPTLIDTARTFGHRTVAVLWRVILPASAPLILAGMRVSLGIGLILVVLSEMLAGTGGLGQLIMNMQHMFKVRETFAWLVILAAVGFALAMLFDWAERKLTFWNAPKAQ
jgi:ABC-type nitrate/sulfonate/bicarbonate transport system permease component